MFLYTFIQESDVTNREVKELQHRNNELQQLVDSLRNECEELGEKHVIQTQKFREELRSLHNKHKQEVASLDTSHKVGSSCSKCGCILVFLLKLQINFIRELVYSISVDTPRVQCYNNVITQP